MRKSDMNATTINSITLIILGLALLIHMLRH